jgi:hypothetical protein
MGVINTQNVADAIVKLVANDALPALVGNLVMGNLVNRQYDSALANVGDTVNVPIPPVMKANNLADGGSVQTQSPSLGNAQIVLNTHSEATFKIPDIVKVLAFPELLAQYMQPAIIAIAESIETDLLKLYTNLSQNAAVGTGAATITENVLDVAETALFNAKVPVSEQKYLVVSAATYGDLRQIARFTEDRIIGGNGAPIINGEVGKLKGFLIPRSQFVQKVSTTTFNVAFAKDAFALAMRRLPQPLPGTGAVAQYAELGNFGVRVVMSYDSQTLAQQFTVDCLYGCGVLRNAFGVQVLS